MKTLQILFIVAMIVFIGYAAVVCAYTARGIV